MGYPPGMATLGTRVRLRRAKLGLSQTALAGRVGIRSSALCDIELGRRGPGAGVHSTLLARLADELGCSTDWLLGRRGKARQRA